MVVAVVVAVRGDGGGGGGGAVAVVVLLQKLLLETKGTPRTLVANLIHMTSSMKMHSCTCNRTHALLSCYKIFVGMASGALLCGRTCLSISTVALHLLFIYHR